MVSFTFSKIIGWIVNLPGCFSSGGNPSSPPPCSETLPPPFCLPSPSPILHYLLQLHSLVGRDWKVCKTCPSSGSGVTTHTCHSTFEGCLQITAHFIITAALNHALISSFTVFSPTASKSSFGFTLVHLWERIWINSVLRFRCTSAAADTLESPELTRGLHWLQLSSFKNICFGFFFAIIICKYFETIHNGVLYVSLWSESPQVVNVLLTGTAQVLSSPHGNQIGDKEVEKLCWPSQDYFPVPVPKYYI